MSGERCAADTANDGMGRVIAYRVALSGWPLRHLWPIARLFTHRRANRLRRPEQFRRVRHEGRTVTSPWLALTAAPGRRNAVRCGFVAGRQIGGAVQRNRARRRVREAVRLLLPSLQSGYDLVFIIRSPEVVEAPFSQLQADIAALLRQAGILNAPEPESTASATSHPQHERGSS